MDELATPRLRLRRLTLDDAPDLPIGISGLVKRATLPEPDLGYAFLPRFRACGYATESAAAVIRDARATLGIGRILGITTVDNAGSIKVLENLGLRFDRLIRLSPDEAEISLYVSEPSAP